MPEPMVAEQKNTRLHGEKIRRYLRRRRGRHVSRDQLRCAIGITKQQMERAVEWLTFDDVRLCENDDGALYYSNEQN